MSKECQAPDTQKDQLIYYAFCTSDICHMVATKEYLAKFLFVLITAANVWKEWSSPHFAIQQCSLVVQNKGMPTSIHKAHTGPVRKSLKTDKWQEVSTCSWAIRKTEQ